MPQIRKLSSAEVQALHQEKKGPRRIVQEEYDALLSTYTVGDYGEAMLEPHENRLSVRNRLRAAAGRRHMDILFRRTNGATLRFQIVAAREANGASGEEADT